MTDTLTAGTRLAERYEIEEVIGRGRSPVYCARDTRLGRAVAVKQVGLAVGAAGAAGSADRARALREARSAARVLSPSAVQVYDVVEERDAVWLVMELVRAPNLDRLVAERGPLDEVRAALVGLWVLDALDAAHGLEIVHRDVRPANVLVGDLDDAALDVPVKLADFGLAALRDDTSVTAPGALSGSPAFTAPEQASGRKAGPEADLWALGAVLYFAVEGEPPFAGDSPPQVAAAVVQGDVRPAQRLDRLGRIVEMLLDTQPERRPDAGRVRAVLHSVATGTEPGDDTAPSPAGTALAAAASAGAVAADPTAVAGAGGTAPSAVAGSDEPRAVAGAGGTEPTAVAGPGSTDPTAVAGAGGTEPTAVAGPGSGGPTAVAGAGRARPTRGRHTLPYLVAAAAAALMVLAGLAVVQGRSTGDPEPEPSEAPVTTLDTGTTEPPEPDDPDPAISDPPPTTAPADGGEAPEVTEPPEPGDDGPGAPAPETTTTAPAEDPTTTAPTTEPPPTTTTAPPTTEPGPATTAADDAGAGAGGAATLTTPAD
ncbi:MAG TPA: protein kinase [Acidimicrobiales bacterium]